MKKYFIPGILMTCTILAASCGDNTAAVVSHEGIVSSGYSSEDTSSDENVVSSEPDAPTQASKADTSSRDALLYEAGMGGGMEMCQEHNPWYHTVPVELINHVGNEASLEWERETLWSNDAPHQFNEKMTIQNFIEHFEIDRETFLQCVRPEIAPGDLTRVSEEFKLDHVMTGDEYYNRFSFTDEEIDALYSGDQAQINAAFCGPLAFVGEADGELYSIYWLADHSAEDYVEAGLPMDKVEEILTLAQEEYAMDPSIAALTETVQDTLSRAIALEGISLN